MKSQVVNILAVDDETAVSTTIQIVLKRYGYSVDTLHNGQEALARLTGSPGRYQILITDHNMPEMTGIQLLQQLKPTDFRGKIIVLSGYLNLELEEQYRLLGADIILRKPFELHELRQAVEALRK